LVRVILEMAHYDEKGFSVDVRINALKLIVKTIPSISVTIIMSFYTKEIVSASYDSLPIIRENSISALE